MALHGERKAEAQPLGSSVTEADDVVLPVTVIMPGAAAVASALRSPIFRCQSYCI